MEQVQQYCHEGCGAAVGLPEGGMGVMVWKCKPGTIALERVEESPGVHALRCLPCEGKTQHPSPVPQPVSVTVRKWLRDSPDAS